MNFYLRIISVRYQFDVIGFILFFKLPTTEHRKLNIYHYATAMADNKWRNISFREMLERCK